GICGEHPAGAIPGMRPLYAPRCRGATSPADRDPPRRAVRPGGRRPYRGRMRRAVSAHALELRGQCDTIRLLADGGFREDARERALSLLALWPDEPELPGLLGALAHREGALSEAMRHWSRLYDVLGFPPHVEFERLRFLATANDHAPTAEGWVTAART